MNDREIAEAAGSNRKIVCDWRKQNKLPAHMLRCQNWEACDEIYLPLYEQAADKRMQISIMADLMT